MANFKSSDLKYQGYVWSTRYNHDDPRVTGEPDSTLLARTEGWEVLYFINKFMDIYKLTSVESGQKVERILKSYVPSEIRSQSKIKDWIYDNWGKIV